MKIQAPNSVGPVQIASRTNNTRDTLQRGLTAPQFRWETAHSAGQRKVNILPAQTGGGDSQIILPFRVTDANRNWLNTTEITGTTGWLIDLDTSVINLTAKSGGHVDGIALTASMPYMAWGFLDTSKPADQRFQGFGLTRYPVCLYTNHTNGNKGTSAVLTLAGTNENRGFRFTIGAKCLVREGTLPTSPYNQGTITAVAVDSVTVSLDNDTLYGTNLTAATGGTLTQLDMFEPKMPDTGRVYPGSGSTTTEYDFIYMGMVITDGSSNIKLLRYRGDPYLFVTTIGPTFYTVVTAGADTGTRTLARYMPIGAYDALILISVARGLGAGTVVGFVATDSAQTAATYTDDITVSGDNSRQNWKIPVNSLDASVYTSVTSSAGASATGNFVIQGFERWAW